MTDLAIRTEGLAKHFDRVRAVDGLDLEVPAGTLFGFLGPNGAGKTTTIQLLLGLLHPNAGRAEVLGFDTATEGAAIRERTGALLEHHGLYEQLSAEENLEFHARIWRLDGSERVGRVREALERVELWDRRGDRVVEWSRGMKQKLALARALLHGPQLVFLDEPTAGLDVVAAKALREELRALVARDGLTVFLTTHNMAEAEELCARVAVIRAGRVLAVGRPEELRARGAGRVEVRGAGLATPELVAALRARPEVGALDATDERLELGLAEGGAVPPLVRLIVEHGGDVEEVRRGKASLEEAFLELVGEGAVGREPVNPGPRGA